MLHSCGLSFKILILILAGSRSDDPESEFCAVTCDGKPHTMCQYQEGGGPECEGFERGLGPKLREYIVRVHNELRDMVTQGRGKGPSAADMMMLVWSDEAAMVAQRWADQCQVDSEKSDACRSLLDGERGGQIVVYTGNIAYKSPYDFISEALMNVYRSNETAFDLSTVGSYVYNQLSAAYSQMIWARTERVGCGFAKGMKDGAPAHKLVCNYYPQGNILGQPVYKTGTPCTQCPYAKCSQKWQGLCAPEAKTIYTKTRGTAGAAPAATSVIVLVCGLIKCYLT